MGTGQRTITRAPRVGRGPYGRLARERRDFLNGCPIGRRGVPQSPHPCPTVRTEASRKTGGMGHQTPEPVTETASGRRPDVVESRPVSAPATELHPLDALAARATPAPAGASPASTLRPSSIQRLQLRAGNAAVTSMLQRRAAPTVRKPSPAVQRRASTSTG